MDQRQGKEGIKMVREDQAWENSGGVLKQPVACKPPAAQHTRLPVCDHCSPFYILTKCYVKLSSVCMCFF